MVAEISYDDFLNKTNTETCVVEFSAQWCGPCKVLTRNLDELSDEMNFSFYKIDVDDDERCTMELGIMSLPYIKIYKNGKLTLNKTGSLNKESLRSLIKQTIVPQPQQIPVVA